MATQYDGTKHEAFLTKIFSGKAGRDYLLSLKGREAEDALGLMQQVLDEGKFNAGQVTKAMETLSGHSGKFPPRYWLDNVKCGEPFDEGGNGDVYKGDWRKMSVALKFARYWSKNAEGNAIQRKQFCHEVFLWQQLSHPNISPFLGLYKEDPRIAMVSKWQPNGNLKDYLKAHPEADRYDLLIQATNGLAYLHEQRSPIVHLDLKPENILISDTCTAMLTDFGFSRMRHNLTSGWSLTRSGFTLYYGSPEVNQGSNEVTVSSDIWSLGMVVFTAFTGELPYKECRHPWESITKAIPPQRPLVSMTDKGRGFTDDLWTFLEQNCWAKAGRDRPLARDCSERLKQLKSRWLSKTIAAPVRMIEGSEISIRFTQEFDTLGIQICLPVVPNYARGSQLHSKAKRFGITLEIHESLEEVKLQGKEENVLAAKVDILSDIERLNNVITKTVPIPARFHALLIGQGGESVKAMEQRHSVGINFNSKKGIVEIQGAPCDVSAAENMLKIKVDHLHDFREIPVTKDVSDHVRIYRVEILSKLHLQELKTVCGTVIYMRGSKEALDYGQTYIRQLQEYLDNEVIEPIEGDTNLLRQIFKSSSWLETVTNCGGPSDPVMQKRITPLSEGHFSLRATPKVLQALIPKLHLEVERRRKRVIGVEIPQDLHKSLVREHGIDDIQRTTGASIFFPHNNRYHKFDPENDLHLTTDPKHIVKIYGTYQSCENARKELKNRVEQEYRLRRGIPVSARIHHNVFKLVFRELKRSDIQIMPLSSQPLPPLEACSPPPPMSTEPLWERYNIYKDEDEEVKNQGCIWILRATTEGDVENAVKTVKDIIQEEMHNSWKGLLTFAANSTFGRIIGTQGETVKRLQGETNTRIDVPKPGEGTTIVIIGPRTGVDEAKDRILRLTSPWKEVSNE